MNIPIIYQSVSYDQHSMIHNDVKILIGNCLKCVIYL